MNCFARHVASIAFAALAAAGAATAAEPDPGSGPAALKALAQGAASWATAENDLGEVEDSLPLSHLTVVLKRSPERQQAFDEFLRQQQDPGSPNFHRWLTPVEVGEQFGVSAESINAVTSWLETQGLRVDGVANSRVRIEFSGSAANVGAAFALRLHTYLVDGEQRISPAAVPQIPAALSAIVQAVHGLQTTHEGSSHHSGVAQVAVAPGEQPNETNCSGNPCTHRIWPADFAIIYDVNPVYQQAINGSGQTIAIIGRANVYLPDIENFQMRAGLTIKDPVTILPPNGIDPGPAQSSGGTTPLDQSEATLDVTRAGSVAPGATINLVISANSSTVTGLAIAGQYVVDTTPVFAQIMSISFSSCEQDAGQASVAFSDSLFSQAAAEGISVFVSSGDSGAAGCDKSFTTPPASQIASPNSICASSYATCVGGTQFADTGNPSAYWRTTNTTGFESALGYIPEGAWNEPLNSSGAPQPAASGGGVSSYIPTPSWQTVAGVPGRQGRYTPDISFSASAHDSYFICLAASGTSCVSDNTGVFRFSSFDGTSAAAPSMAGIAALLNQKMRGAQGNLNPRLYALAANPANAIFHDITVATSGVGSCDPSVPSMCNNSTPGPTSLTGGLVGYTVNPGYDLVTGLGSIDVANLLSHWSLATAPGQLQVPLSITFADQPVGTQSAAVTKTITNVGGTPVTVSSVTDNDLTDFPGNTTCVATLQPGGQCTLTISFAPSAVGFHSATVTLNSNGVGSPQSFTVSGTGTAATTNYQGLWWAAPANSESGWGINFAHQGDTIFATWFTYDLFGTGNWLVMTAPKTAPNTYSGTLYSTTGPPFNSVPFNPTQVTASAVGVGTLTFTDANDGSFAYTIGSTSQAKTITRQVFGTLPTCATATASLAAATNYTDLWWAAPPGSESGWGINLTHEGTIIFGSWFTYDVTGKPMWLVVTAPQSGANAYSGTLYRTTGPPFNSVPFNPANVVATPVGSATFAFSDGNSATFAYTVNGISQSKSITRELFSGAGTVCH